ncbi:MAG: general secretion pathway protein GspF, partial [Candidatus Thiodiazotropha taylori]|nr:general secretion pathway protein GspF [Candidatus Thiodiazotropha endolucinida]MCW4227158.1 general secretion pathway protein GspF [Candidatus Thiodiazotropha taylori]
GSSPAANNVNQLVLTVALNYLALHGEQGQFSSLFGTSLGNATMLDSLTAFNPIM